MRTGETLQLWRLQPDAVEEAAATVPGTLAAEVAGHRVRLDDHIIDELTEAAGERGVVLELVDREPAVGRRCRFYSLHVQPALFGCVHVVRSWGRLGHQFRPRHLVTCHPTIESAHAALRPLVRRRLRRGYHPSRSAR
ncbi:MAG: WGR domain-containing protein [Candidatus Dormibacteria bacterium]